MAHILFAAPPLARFHLHERLARALQTRGHRVTVLTTEAVELTFWSHQGLPAHRVRPGRAPDVPLPISEFAAQDGMLAGQPRPGGRALDGAARRLRRVAGGILRQFETDPPDLVLLHQARSGLHRLIHFIGREVGSRILWTGDGLLPNTIQWDEEGLDGDSSLCRRRALDYRGVQADEVFLASALSGFVGRAAPAPLARTRVVRPPLVDRLGDALRAWPASPWAAVSQWQRALAPEPPLTATRMNLPGRPFVAVLLQHETDPRLTLDAPESASPFEIVRAACRAAHTLEPGMPVVAVLPERGLARGDLGRVAVQPSVRVEFATALPDAMSAALAVVTINEGAASGALLAGTPVLHLGRSPYGIRGVARRTSLEQLTEDLSDVANGPDQMHLRQRFLTWLFQHGHLWCNPDHPDHNGMSGFVAEIEDRIERGAPRGGGLRYRAGPAWPLTPEPA